MILDVITEPLMQMVYNSVYIQLNNCMVNAIIPNLPTPASDIEVRHIVQYLDQLHYVRGYDRICILPPFSNATSLSYVDEYPRQIENEVNATIEIIIERLNSILWDLKKTDYMEANLQPFVYLFSLWLKAKQIKAIIIFPTIDILSPVVHLCQVLIDDRRDCIGTLADDIELWFFSHFADVYINIPYFINFTPEIRNSVKKYVNIKMLRELLNILCNYPTSSLEWRKRDKIISKIANYWRRVVKFTQILYKNQIIATPVPIAVSNRNLSSFEKLEWKHKNLMSIFKDHILKDSKFDPYFIIDNLYPKELLKGIELLKRESPERLKDLIDFAFANKGYTDINFAYHRFTNRLLNL